jgi:hypothetical protein
VQALVPCYADSLDSYPCNPEEKVNFECRRGHIGRLCSNCDEGWYLSNRKCYECPAHVVPAIMALFILAFFMFYMYLVRSAPSQTHNEMASIGKAFFFYLQTANILFAKSSFVWPGIQCKMIITVVILSLDSVMKFQDGYLWSNISFSIFSCMNTAFNFKANYILVFLSPPIFLAVSFIIYLIGHFYYKWTAYPGGTRLWRLGCIRAIITCINLAYLPLTVSMLQVKLVKSSCNISTCRFIDAQKIPTLEKNIWYIIHG